jgi:chromosome segregation ATPase
MRGRIGKLEAAQTTTTATLEKFDQHLDSTDLTMRASSDALAQKLGMTEKELQVRTAELQQEQRASVSQLAQEQKEQIEGVKTEVGSVRTEVGSVKTDVDATKSDLKGTKDKLEHTVGDLGVQSGLIARTREDLEFLKHRGDRNYYEFTLMKGQSATGVSSVRLQLKTADAKRGKYTLNVVADDRVIEKKDRTMFEPLQFYTGRNRQLYEVVVLTVDKNKVSGYLSTPKEMVAQAQ